MEIVSITEKGTRYISPPKHHKVLWGPTKLLFIVYYGSFCWE